MKISTTITNCKKTAFAFLAVLFCLIVQTQHSTAQVSAYGFTQSSGAYTNLATTTGFTTVVTAPWDDATGAITIPFSFSFNGTAYTTFTLSTNGFITFGGTAPSGTYYTPISGTTAYSGAIAGIGRDLGSRTGTFNATWTSGSNILTLASGTLPPVGTIISGIARITDGSTVTAASGTTITLNQNTTGARTGSTAVSYYSGILIQNTGTAPNRKFSVQWSWADAYNGSTLQGSNLNFQIVLNETTNDINVIYGTNTPNATLSPESGVGLRGASTADFNDRTGTNWAASTAGGASTSTMTLSNANFPASGQTYTWSTPKITTGTITPLTYCAGVSTATASVPFTSVGTYTSFTAQLSNASGSFAAPVSIGTGSTSPIGVTIPAGTVSGTGYRIRVISTTPAVTGTDNGANITINNPVAPTATTPQTFCQINNPTVANLVATPSAGGTIQWYVAATGGSALAAGTALTNTTYYASQTISGCEGSARVAVAVTISNPAAPTATTPQTFCQIANPTVANLTTTSGSGIQWYTAATGGTALPSGTALVTGTYYASQTVGTCEGTARVTVNVTVNNPAAPTGAASQSFCQINNPTLASIVTTPATGIKWYTAATGGTLLPNTTALVNGTTYYASQTLSGCESVTRLAVTITVGNPAAPTGAASQSFCTINNPTVADLAATGTAIQWYSAATGGTALASTTALVSGTTYYASQTVSGCESATRFAVSVTISNPAAPTGAATQSFCSDANPTVANLTATGTTIQWYSAATGGTPLAGGTALVNGTHYYASQTVGTCESATRFDVTANVYTAVSINSFPNPSTQTLCATQNVSYTVSATGTGLTYQWYLGSTAVTNGGRISGATTSNLVITGLTIADGGDYTVVVSGTSPCSPVTSAITHLDVNQSIVFTTQPTTPQTLCPGQTYTISASVTGTVSTYQWLKNGSAYATGTFDGANTYTLTIPNLTSADAGSYRLLLDDGSGTGCSAANSNIAVLNINTNTTTTDPLATQTVCQNAASTNLSATASGTGPFTYQWYSNTTNNNTTGTPISGQTGSTFTPPTTTAATTYYYVIVTGTCNSATSATAQVIVNPLAFINAKTATTCSGTGFSVTPVNGVGGDIVPTGTTYSWAAPTVSGGLTGGAGGTNAASITGTLTNPTNTNQTATYTVTPTSGSCAGATFTITVTVNPKPSVTAQTAITCSATGFTVTPTNGSGNIVPAGTTYSWSAPTVTGGLTGGATGTNAANISGTLTNPTNTAQTATYIVTPTSGTCTGATFTVTITVNPQPAITNKTATTCSATGFTVTPANGTDVVPAGTTYSWSAPTVTGGITGGAAGTNAANIGGTLTNPTNTAQTATYTVTPASGTCTGSTFTVTVTVNPKATIAAKTQTICSGGSFTVTPANGTDIVPAGTTYSWSAPTMSAGITGGVAGSGTSITGTLINSNNTNGTATYTVTPTSGTCTGSAFTVTVTVTSTPSVTNQTTSACSGAGFSVTPTNGSGNIVPTGTTYSWSVPAVTGGVTGGAAGTNAANITGTLTNPTNTAQTATYTVTPASGVCTGSTFTVTVTVNPKATITAKTSTTCSGTGFSVTPVDGSGGDVIPSGTTYSWGLPTVTGTMTGGATGTNAPSITGTLNNPTNTVQTATYTVTPTSGTCTGTAFTVTVTVNPKPSVTAQTVTTCSGTGFTVTPTNGGGNIVPSGTTYSWAAPTMSAGITGGVAGSGTSITGTLINSNNTNGTATYTVTPTSGICTGSTFTVTVTVSSQPFVTAQTATTCSGTGFSITPTNGSGNIVPTGTKYSWSAPTVTGGMTGGASGTNQSNISGTLNNTTVTAQTATYTVTPTSGTCTGPTFTVTVTVNPLPTITTTGIVAPRCYSAAAQSSTLPYTATTQTPTTYSINWASGLTDVTDAALPATPITIPIPAGRAPGTYNGVLTVKNANGCTSGNVAVSITINALPVPTLTNNPASPVCANTSVTYTTDAGQSNYVWTFSGTLGTDYTIVSGGNSTSSTAVITWKTSTPATKTVTVNYNNGNGCTAVTPTSNSITVLAVPAGSIIVTENSGTMPNDYKICAGDAVTFTAPSGYGSYTWKVAGTIVQGPNTDNTYSTTALTTGQTVTVDIANANNCGATFTAPSVTVSPLPAPTLTVNENSGTSDDKIICPNASVTLTAPLNAGSTYSFIINGTTVSTGTSNTYTTTAIASNSTVAILETNSNGCQATTATQNITVTTVPAGTLSVSPGNSFCIGTSVTFTATATAPTTGYTYNFKVNSVSKQNNATNTYITNTLTNGQVVTVDVINSNGCITTFNPIAVTVNPLPTGTLTATENSGIQNDNTICSGSPVTFTATSGYSNYTFYLKGTGTALYSGSSNVYTNSALVNNDYLTVVVTSGSSCTATFTSATITVVASPTGTLMPSMNPICAGTNETFTATTGYTNYNFQVNGTTVQNGSSNTYSTTTLAPGDAVTVDVTGSNGCISTFTASVTINPTPTGTLAIAENSGAANDGTICTGTSVTFTAPNGFTNYNFLLNGSSIQNGASKTYTTTTLADNDKVTVAVTGSGGCIGLLNQYTITVNPLPTVAPITTTAPSFDVCVGSTITLQDATNSGGTFTWSSENPVIATVNASMGVVAGAAAGTAIIDYIFTNSNGCSTTVTATVTVHALPTVQPITGNFNICTGTNSQLSDATTGTTVTWSSNNTAIATVDATGLVHGAAPGTATISYAVTDTYGCTTTVTADVTVSDIPAVAPITTTAPSFDVCVGGTLLLKDATTGGTWSVVNGTGTATITSGGILTGLTAGTVLVSYGINSSCGLPAFAQQTVNVNTPPSATISYAGTPFCTTSGTVTPTLTGTPGGTYSSTTGLTINNSNGTITPASSTVGTYTVTYTIPATATGGCGVYTTTTSVTITAAPSATIAYSASPYCSNGGTATVTRTGTSGGTYTKTAGAGTLSLNASTGDITLGTSTSGTYTVTYTVAASGGCSLFSTTASVTITTAPSATIAYSGSPYCSNGGTATVTRTGTVGGTYTKTAGAGTLSLNSSTGDITLGTSTPGTYTVTYTIAASAGCAIFTATASVTITAAPTAVAGTAVTTCSNNPPVNITAGSSATNYSSLVWTSSGTGTFANQGSLTATTYAPSAADIAAGSVTLTLKANGNGGCAAATSTKTLTISAPPAAFTLTPSSASICQGDIQSLTATNNTPTTGTMTISSGTISVPIPDGNDIYIGPFYIGTIPGSVTTNLNVSTIPVGAIVTGMSINFNVTHTYDGDLVLNVKAPNGNVLNMVNNRGGSGDNFSNTIISSTAVNPVNAGVAPFNATTYTADNKNNVGTPNSGNLGFPGLYSTPNGTWTFGAEDDAEGDVGTITSWSITFNYTIPVSPLNVVWSPTAGLYTDPGATAIYTGAAASTVYASPATTTTYSATASNAANCSTTQTVSVTVKPVPVVTITADYCAVAGKVRLTANSTPAAISYLWSTGETTQSINVDVSGDYDVTVYVSGLTCPGKGTINVANELIKNGNFEMGNVGFISSYPYRTGAGSLNNPPGYAVDTAASYYGPGFLYGKDHTTTHGKFMMVNGAAGANYQIWQETISVLPNTTYYFSAWGLELDNLPVDPIRGAPANATLQFNVNGNQTGTLGNLPRPPASTNKDTGNHQWVRFYGSWTSGPTTTSAVVAITDLQGAVYGNNFGLDDISFGTLSTFVDLQSAPGTDAQTVCVNNSIQNIIYSAGSSASAPTVTGLPAGVTSSWNGLYLTISGTPTVAGNYSYTVTTTGSCQPASASGTITVQAQKIALSSGSSSPSVCANAAMPNIVFTLSGTATGATTTGLPTGVTGTLSGSGPTYTYTVSGTPTAAAGTYPYTITTSGTCTPVTFNGTITITSQTITLNSANNTQTVCINSPIANIQYTVAGTGTNASVIGLPSGVTGTYNSGLFVISGSPTSAAGSPYTYTVTTSGTSCAIATATGTITVTPAASFTLTSGGATNPQTVCKGSAITNITYSVTNATGASATGLPAGVTGAFSGGVFTISGTPTAAAGTYNYIVTSSGGCAVGTITGSITIQAQTISLSSGARSPSVCANTSMSNIVFTIGGTATGATVSGVPTGVTGTLSGTTFTIGGTPTGASGTYHYTITTSGSSCSAVTDTGTITIQAAAVGGTLTSVSICSGSSGTLTLTGQTGAVTRWEVSTDFGATWTQIANTTISQNFSNVITTTMYRVLVSGCGTVYSSVATVGVHNLWTGRTSTDWNVTSNWSDNLLPSATCTTVMIPASTPYKPQLTGNATVPNLTIAPNTNLDLNGSTLTINGVFSGSTTGYLIGSNTSGVIIGGSATSLYFDQTTPSSTNVLKTLTVNSGGSATLGNTLNITAGSVPGVLIANGTLNAAGNLTLKSDYSGTASVGPSSGTISGNVSVERFIPPLRAWRFLTTPTNSTQSINAAWQEGAAPNATVSMRTNPNPGYGTEITYDNLTAHGYDVNTTYNASIKYWDSAANGWNTPPNTYVALRSHDAYCLFVRGSRAVDLSLAVSAPPDLTILRAYGTLNQTNGNPVIRSITGVAAGGGLFVGNPYASSIDITTLIGSGRVTGVNPNQFSVWDPKRSGAGTSNVGGYVDYSAGMIAPNGSPSYPTAASATIIESGEGFFIPLKTGSTSASAQFQETDKSSTQAPVFGRQLPEQSPSGIYANLMVPTAKGLFLVDGVASGFGKNYNADVDQMDFRKNPNFDENMMLVRNDNFLSIEFRPIPVITDTLFYKLYIRQQPYVLQVFSQNMSSIPGQAWLVDKYLNTKTAVNLGDTLLYSFTPNTDLASYRDRFMLVFKRTIKATPVATTMSSGGATAATLEGKVDVYPNPAITGSKVLLKFSSMRAGNYEITLSSLEGTVLTKKSVEHEGGNYNYDLQLDARWATGNYLITITGKNGYSTTAKLIIGQ